MGAVRFDEILGFEVVTVGAAGGDGLAAVAAAQDELGLGLAWKPGFVDEDGALGAGNLGAGTGVVLDAALEVGSSTRRP